MMIRTLLFSLITCASATSTAVFAHTEGHDDEKMIPATCEQLADKERYTDDVAYPEVKALTEQCAADQEEAAPVA